MITIIPALDFIRSLCGNYAEAVEGVSLRIWSCGYGVAIDLRGQKKTEFVGVVGAFQGAIECYAQVGLPNVIRFVGERASERSLRFVADDVPLELVLSRDDQGLGIAISLHGKEKVAHVLRAA